MFRITSTYVEKTQLWDVFLAMDQDHLHIRGENPTLSKDSYHHLGSPPHTWRKRGILQILTYRLRITSTYVEKTTWNRYDAFIIWDHLHIRGENQSVAIKSSKFGGSPPHTWRKPVMPNHYCQTHRITSTYVEKTLFSSV